MSYNREWEDTSEGFRCLLGRFVDEDVKRTKAWPGGGLAFSNRMKGIAPALREHGLVWEEAPGSRREGRKKSLRWAEGAGPTEKEMREARSRKAERERDYSSVLRTFGGEGA